MGMVINGNYWTSPVLAPTCRSRSGLQTIQTFSFKWATHNLIAMSYLPKRSQVDFFKTLTGRIFSDFSFLNWYLTLRYFPRLNSWINLIKQAKNYSRGYIINKNFFFFKKNYLGHAYWIYRNTILFDQESRLIKSIFAFCCIAAGS